MALGRLKNERDLERFIRGHTDELEQKILALQDSGVRVGDGDPEGVVVGVVGDLFRRRDGGAGTSLYVKESGAGNTGWVAK